MYLLAIDDTVLGDLGLNAADAMLTTESDRYAWSVERATGLSGSAFTGSAAEPAIYHVVIKCPDLAARNAVLSALTSDPTRERRLRAQRLDREATIVIGYATTVYVAEIGDLGLGVDFDASDSLWVAERPVISRKSFASQRDQMMAVAVPGTSRVAPSLRIAPLAPRSAPSATVGWSKRRRYIVHNGSDEPLYRYPWRLDLGDTRPLVTNGKALASGNDVRVWLDGIEQARALISWNAAASYCWIILPALLPGDDLVVEIVYGNPAAGPPPGLTYPDLPAFSLALSTNASHVYATNAIAANAGLGLWWQSSGTERAIADFAVPGAWQPVATLENPDAPDRIRQARSTPFTDGGTFYYANLDAWRGPPNSTRVGAGNPFDGAGLYNPLGIVSITCGFVWVNDGGWSTLVGLARDSASEGWNRFYTNAGAGATVAPALRAPSSPTKWVAFSVWPDDFVELPERDKSVEPPTGPPQADYARARFDGNTTVAIDSSRVTVQLGATTLGAWTPPTLGGSLRAWWDAATIEGVADGATLPQWDDQSGSGHHAIRTDPPLRPRYRLNQINGLPAVDFDGVDDRYATAGLTASLRDETIVAVIRADAAGGNVPLLGTSNTGGRVLYRTPTGAFLVVKDGVATLAASTGTIAAGATGIVAVTIGASSIQFALNGTAETVVANGVGLTAGRETQLGSNHGAGGNEYGGLVGEMLISGALTVAERQAAEGYLAHRWGITAALPAGHPYKTIPPTALGDVSEADIYELATEIRHGGGDPATAPYTALLIGNAREQSGAGTRRAACLLSEAVLIDGERRRHEIWAADLTHRVEGVSAHAVRAVVGWEDEGATAESPTSDWLPLLPVRPQMPNGTFPADIGGWQEYATDAGLTVTRVWDGAVGGAQAGSLALTISANSAGAASRARVIGPRVFAVADREAVSVAGWMLTTNPALEPRLFLVWVDEDGATLSIDEQTAWTPVAGEPVERVLAARAPSRAAVYRIGVGVVAAAGATGTVWFDDLRPNDTDLFVRGAAIGSIEVVASVYGKWL